MNASPLLWVVPLSGVLAIAVAGYFAYDVLRSPIGTPAMQKVAGAIYVAAVAFIQRQYRTIALLAVGGMVLIGLVIYFFESAPGVSASELAIKTSIAFIVGALCSMASGIVGMFVAVKSNLRTAAAAQHSVADALRISLRGGAVSGILVVGLSLIGVFVMFIAYGGFEHPDQAPFTMRRSSRSSRSLAAGSTRKPPISAPTSSEKSKREFPKTTRATRLLSRTWSATT